jgi:hypothetical protein
MQHKGGSQGCGEGRGGKHGVRGQKNRNLIKKKMMTGEQKRWPKRNRRLYLLCNTGRGGGDCATKAKKLEKKLEIYCKKKQSVSRKKNKD